MSLNIRSEAAHKMAKDLAALTGESVTEAVTVALRERLERLQRPREGSLAEQLLAIGKECAAHLREPYKSIDHAELLYDGRGLPK
jgi:antitoxin VapB